jgi:hypothetical protein
MDICIGREIITNGLSITYFELLKNKGASNPMMN